LAESRQRSRLKRRQRDLTPTLNEYLRDKQGATG
jgi:hypothetical protein